MQKERKQYPSQGTTLCVVMLDDNPFEGEHLAEALGKNTDGNVLGCQFKVETFDDVSGYLARLQEKPSPDVVLLDVDLGKQGRGSDLIEKSREILPRLVIMMRSGLDDVQVIRDCLKRGADDFLSKVSDTRELGLRVWNGYRLARLKRGEDMRQEIRHTGKVKDPVNTEVGPTLQQISKRIPMLIKSAVSAIHVSGESGTGKEKVADLFHAVLAHDTPFVRVNCGAIAPSLLESELFGHAKGSFTGAASEKKGYLETASGGWIFLDEVGTLTPQAQVALLRVIENHEVVRVGESLPRRISIRVLSATNESLEDLVRQGKFRKDLWQRLCETKIHLPPLRERKAEIAPLVKYFCEIMPGGPYEISESALDVLTEASWKNGNVRELRNCLRAMTELHVNRLLTPLSIPGSIWEKLCTPPLPAKGPMKARSPNPKAQVPLAPSIFPMTLENLISMSSLTFSYWSSHGA